MAISNVKTKKSIFHALTLNFQRGLVRGTLDNHKGNVTKAAKELGITRMTLGSILKSDAPVVQFIKPLERRQVEE